MEKITKKEVVRLLTENKSCLLGLGLKGKDLSIEDIFEEYKDIQIDANSVFRTAKSKRYRLVFSDYSVLDLSTYVNNKENVAEFYRNGNIILLYAIRKSEYGSNFDIEHVIIYAIV